MGEKGVRLLKTPEHHGYNLAFSPFNPDLIAVAAAQNFGLMGGGRLFILSVGSGDELSSVGWDGGGLLDVAWSENAANVIVTADGNGSLQVWDTSHPQSPVGVYREHTKDVCSVSWSQTRDLHHVVSASWDSTIKIWDMNHKHSLRTLTVGESLVYEAVWSPHIPGCMASVSGDGALRIWNSRGTSNKVSVSVGVSEGEVLTCDWCKYNQNIIATADTHRDIRGWDLRNTTQPIFVLTGHNYPPRRIKFSSFLESQLASVSYDFTTRIWDYKLSSPLVHCYENHQELHISPNSSPPTPKQNLGL
ncbi:hypothetical protein Pcinc_043937 [Petrolisthes cinctipes]|uniref:Peroxin-7 n=1 Tax=Petrolisthes cinctipes TaxID=88211 RepID=A0AAE1BF09_PETCI|nr:hypothetical protein Pcinc_043937 [Petrolisthes cinctipes]